MSMTRLSIAALAIAAALTTGCSKDEDVASFIAEFDTFSSTIVKSVKSAPSLPAGIDAAQKYLDANKESIRTKLAAIKEVKNFQISEETKKKLETSFMTNAQSVASLPLDYVGPLAMNEALRVKMEKLINDYRDTVAK